MLLHKMFSKAKVRQWEKRAALGPHRACAFADDANDDIGDVRNALIVVLIEATAALPGLPLKRRRKLERAIDCLSRSAGSTEHSH